jgi:hypothetical protein
MSNPLRIYCALHLDNYSEWPKVADAVIKAAVGVE